MTICSTSYPRFSMNANLPSHVQRPMMVVDDVVVNPPQGRCRWLKNTPTSLHN